MRGKTFIISGPSGVGKSTVLSALLEKRKNLYFSVSATTRDPRPGELDGIQYHFMDAESFRKWIAMDQFLEYAEYVGNFYGTPKRFVDEAMDKGQDVILDCAPPTPALHWKAIPPPPVRPRCPSRRFSRPE